MRLIQAYLAAFRRSYSYDLRKNPYLWFGFAWGCPIPAFSIGIDLALGAAGRHWTDAFAEHPFQVVFLLHPLLFALVFGAMGTLRNELEGENRDLITRLSTLAATDALTGIANRRRVFEELETTLARSSRSGEPFAVVIFDLDGFKRINDEQGHPAGDLLLKKTTVALQSAIRQGDVLGRYGGDEFLLVTHGPIGVEDVLVERAAEAVRRETGLGLSAGIARYPEDGRSGSGLVATADARLYEVKGTRKHRRKELV